MQSTRQLLSQIVLWAWFLTAAGCSQSPTVPVEGRLVWTDGEPARELAGYTVEATLEGSKVTGRGYIDTEGRFQLGTFKMGDGAQPGTLRVCVFSPIPKLVDHSPPPPVKLPDRYAKPESSGLVITAERGKRNDVTLTIDRQ